MQKARHRLRTDLKADFALVAESAATDLGARKPMNAMMKSTSKFRIGVDSGLRPAKLDTGVKGILWPYGR